MESKVHYMLAIETRNIRKTFGRKTAIEDISLRVKKGTIHAILGPNGSGKTTLVRLCTTLLTADSGVISVGGFDTVRQAKKVREIISLTGQNASVDEELTGPENLVLFARLMGYSSSESAGKANNLLDFFELAGSRNQLVKYYSGGMRRKLDLAVSMLRTPEVLFLDEPTTGLDPRSRNELWTIINQLSSQGTTILLTTQYMEEADRLADMITVLDRGMIISEGTSDELKALVGGNILQVTLDGTGSPEEMINLSRLESLTGKAVTIDHENGTLTIPVDTAGQAIESLDRIREEKLVISNFHLTRPDLDEVFLALTGKPAGEDEQTSEAAPVHRSDLRKDEIDRLFGSPVSARHSGIITQHMMFAWRALLKIKHIPEQYIDVLVTPIMFTFMFTYLFGGAVAGSTREYLQFLIPGILVQSLSFNTMYAGINIHTDVSKGIFDRFRSMPVWLPAPLAGIFIGDVLRYLISGIVVMAFGIMIGYRPEAGVPAIALAFLIAIFFASSISWMAVIIGLTFRNASAVMSLGWLILTPIVFMSNIYVDPLTMPAWLQQFIALNPLSWQVDAVRSLLSGRFEFQVISLALAGSLMIILLLAPAGIYFYRKER